MSKYLHRCWWRWLPIRRLHGWVHMRPIPWRLVGRFTPPCEATKADVDWLKHVADGDA